MNGLMSGLLLPLLLVCYGGIAECAMPTRPSIPAVPAKVRPELLQKILAEKQQALINAAMLNDKLVQDNKSDILNASSQSPNRDQSDSCIRIIDVWPESSKEAGPMGPTTELSAFNCA